MHQNQSSASQLKAKQFKNQIRTRMKTDYMRKIRNQFLKLEQSRNQQHYINNITIQQLSILITQIPAAEKIGLMNRIIINRREQICYKLYEKLVGYCNKYFVKQDPANLCSRIQLNDLISLFANILAIQKYRNQLPNLLNIPQATNMLLTLIQKVPKQSGSYILWVLYQLAQLNTQIPQKIAQFQMYLKQKFGLGNIYLSYLFATLVQIAPHLLDSHLIQQYTNIPISKQTQKYFCENIIIIFSNYLKIYPKTQLTQHILKWICTHLVSPTFNFHVKNSLFKLLQYIIKQCLDLLNIIILINHSLTIQQLIQRSLFDSQYNNKITCISSLNQLIKICPKLQLQYLLTNYPSIIQSIISSFRLSDFTITVQSLASIAKIIVNWPNQAEISRVFINNGLRLQLQVLQYCENRQVANLATAILEDYLTQ